MKNQIIYNSKLISESDYCFKHNDRGLTIGHGIYETILVNYGCAPFLKLHWQRLKESAEIIGITIPFSLDELNKMIGSLIYINGLVEKVAGVRITLTAGESLRGLLLCENIKPNFVISSFLNKQNDKSSLSALIVKTIKNEFSLASKAKTISNIDNIFAKNEAYKQGFDEAILLNTQSYVADGSISTFYIVKNNHIYTPQTKDGALPGVIRSILLNEMQHDIPILEKSISVEDALSADEVFISNTLMGIKPIHKLNHVEYCTNKMADKLIQQLDLYNRYEVNF